MRTRPLAVTGMMAISIFTVLATLAITGTTHAAFLPIDTFDNLTPGPIDGQSGWRAYSESSAVVTDPAGGANQVLQVFTESTHLYRDFLLADGATRMLFLRFRYEDQLSVSFGLAETTVPDQFGDFDVELNLTSAGDDLRINDGGSYLDIAALKPATWYNTWLLIDNADNASNVGCGDLQ